MADSNNNNEIGEEKECPNYLFCRSRIRKWVFDDSNRLCTNCKISFGTNLHIHKYPKHVECPICLNEKCLYIQYPSCSHEVCFFCFERIFCGCPYAGCVDAGDLKIKDCPLCKKRQVISSTTNNILL